MPSTRMVRTARCFALAAAMSTLLASGQGASAGPLEDLAKSLGDRVDDLDADVTGLQSDVGSLRSGLDGADASIAALAETVDERAAGLSGLADRVAVNEGGLVNVRNLVSAQDLRLDAVEGGVLTQGVRLNSGLGDLRGDLGSLRSSLGNGLADVQVSLGDLRAGLDRTRIDLDVLTRSDLDPAWRTRIDERTARNTTDISVLRRDTDVHAARLDVHNTRLDGHDTRLDEQDARIDGHDTTLTRHESTLADHGRTVATHTSQIGALADADARIVGELDAQRDALMANAADVSALDRTMKSGFQRLGDAVAQNSRRINKTEEGVAVALALKSPYVPENKTFALSGGWGNFEGRNAFGVSGGLRAGDMIQLDAGVAVGVEDQAVGGRAGATISW